MGFKVPPVQTILDFLIIVLKEHLWGRDWEFCVLHKPTRAGRLCQAMGRSAESHPEYHISGKGNEIHPTLNGHMEPTQNVYPNHFYCKIFITPCPGLLQHQTSNTPVLPQYSFHSFSSCAPTLLRHHQTFPQLGFNWLKIHGLLRNYKVEQVLTLILKCCTKISCKTNRKFMLLGRQLRGCIKLTEPPQFSSWIPTCSGVIWSTAYDF